MSSYKHLFTKSLEHIPAHSHATAHSHHLRPDVVFDAHMECMEDAFKYADQKWGKILDNVYPKSQSHVADLLNTGQPDNVVFAPNTHEFVVRLFSCLPQPARILTTDSEFYSAARQFRRYEESGQANITYIPTEPFESFSARFSGEAQNPYDMIFLSHIFFNSGHCVPRLQDIVNAVTSTETLIVIDGYHAFMALPVDISAIKNRVFYMSGGYKYAMSGEGSCFLHVPDGYALRPVNTGWFAGFDELEDEQKGTVSYTSDAMRFAGSTFDPAGLYRFNAVCDMLEQEGITIAAIHNHVLTLQQQFLDQLNTPILSQETLISDTETDQRGHFLTFKTDKAGDIDKTLKDRGLYTDHRGDRLRFGFGLYHNSEDIEKMVTSINGAPK